MLDGPDAQRASGHAERWVASGDHRHREVHGNVLGGSVFDRNGLAHHIVVHGAGVGLVGEEEKKIRVNPAGAAIDAALRVSRPTGQ